MFRNIPFIASCAVLVLVAVLHLLAIEHDWYFYFWWFDIMMHFLGGLWVGLITSAYLISPKNVLFPRSRSFGSLYMPIFIIALIIGVGWELFELLGGIMHLSDRGYLFDSVKDLLNDSLGGLVGATFTYRTFTVNIGLPAEETVATIIEE